MERKRITRIADVRQTTPDGRHFADAALRARLGLKRMVSIPVLDTSNANQVLVVMNLFPTDDALIPHDDVLSEWARILAKQLETHLHERCYRFANRLEIDLSKVQRRTSEALCGTLAHVIRRAISCDGVTVLLETAQGQKLRTRVAIGPEGPLDGLTRELSEGVEYDTWQQNREYVSYDLRADRTGLDLAAADPAAFYPGVFVPLRDLTGHAKGVVRCVNIGQRSSDFWLRFFTYDDITLIDALGQKFMPQLELLLADQARVDMLNKLAHEMRVPVVAFRAAIEAIEHACTIAGVRFQWDHFEDVRTYVDVMRRLLTQVDVFRSGIERIPLDPKFVGLESAVIAPAKRFVKPLLAKKHFRPEQIEYRGLSSAPHLWIDPAFMTQVVFNLMENAIKYAGDVIERFKLTIECATRDEEIELVFRDNGIGVPEGYNERIFEEGSRGPEAHLLDVAGDGIGLWLARGIAKRHGGDIFLRSPHAPTEFVLVLPRSLEHAAPSDSRGQGGKS